MKYEMIIYWSDEDRSPPVDHKRQEDFFIGQRSLAINPVYPDVGTDRPS